MTVCSLGILLTIISWSRNWRRKYWELNYFLNQTLGLIMGNHIHFIFGILFNKNMSVGMFIYSSRRPVACFPHSGSLLGDLATKEKIRKQKKNCNNLISVFLVIQNFYFKMENFSLTNNIVVSFVDVFVALSLEEISSLCLTQVVFLGKLFDGELDTSFTHTNNNN